MLRDLTEPWRRFLTDLDARVEHDVRLHCCGGFVVTMLYGLARTTADIDVLSILPTEDQRTLATVAGQGSALHKTHGIYLDVVTGGDVSRQLRGPPDRDVPARVPSAAPALDPYDLVLTKLTRSADRDRSDVEYLATAVPLDVAVLRDRYQREMRSYVGVPEREDLTLELWIEIIEEAQQAREPKK